MFKSKYKFILQKETKKRSELEWESAKIALKKILCASFMSWWPTAIYTRDWGSEKEWEELNERIVAGEQKVMRMNGFGVDFVHCIRVGTNEVEAKVEGFFVGFNFCFRFHLFCVALVSSSKSELDEEKMNKCLCNLHTVCNNIRWHEMHIIWIDMQSISLKLF